MEGAVEPQELLQEKQADHTATRLADQVGAGEWSCRCFSGLTLVAIKSLRARGEVFLSNTRVSVTTLALDAYRLF